MSLFQQLDHVAILVRDTDEALGFYRDRLGLEVVLSEVIDEASVRLTHLDLGGVHLQLVQPLTDDHPLQQDLREKGECLHHLCVKVDDVPEAMKTLPDNGLEARQRTPHQGPRGRSAAFIAPQTTRGILWEMTADPPPDDDSSK